MIALREYMKVKNHRLDVKLPDDFDYEDVEVVIIPVGQKENVAWDYWNEEELDRFGKYSFGLSSNDFGDNEEDYSSW